MLLLGWAAKAQLTLQTGRVPGTNQMVLRLQGSKPDWTYRIESSAAVSPPVFYPVLTGAPGQDSFTVNVNRRKPMMFRASGTNEYEHPPPAGAYAAPARTPALGYNSWIGNGASISESLILAIGDAMATNGMRAAGYQYVVLDQGWTANDRNADGTPIISTNFPHGMAYLADYMHARGLKLGLYTGSATNYHGFIGSGGHLAQDGLTYAKWGVDYVKFDGDSRTDFELFGNAFRATGRALFFAPSYGDFEPWIPAETSSWRGNGGVNRLTDLLPGGVTIAGIHYSGWEILLQHIDYIAQYADTVGPGHWNDPDAADPSYWPGGFAKPEMAMFSVLACNLMWSGIPPVQGLPLTALYYLTNSEVIAVHQDAAGIQGTLVAANASGLGQVWCKPLGTPTGNVKAVCCLNRSTNSSQTITVPWSAIGLSNRPALVRDLFQHANVGNFTDSYSVTLGPQDCQLVTITAGAPPFLSRGTNFLSDLGYLAGWTNGSAILFQHAGDWWPARDRAVGQQPMSINARHYEKGIGMMANGWLQFALGGLASTFHAEIGIDDLVQDRSRTVFWVWVDGILQYDSGMLGRGSPTQVIDLPLWGGQVLTLEVMSAAFQGPTSNTDCDWGNAYLVVP